jgi:acetylornithine/N-succinyldiaminopimelate aminotransferase
MLEYTKLLVESTCLDRVFFASSGAEANEGAIKLARKYGQKHKDGAYEIITTTNAFHGRTLTTMSATGKAQWKDLYEPKTKGFKQAKFNDLDSVKALINKNTVAIMLEPVQGEGGVNVASKAFMQGLRDLCDLENVLLILDEVQTGFGRTGKLFAYQHYTIEPDIMTLAKGIGGGFPLSALLAKEFLNIFDAGDQGATYSSQPLAMAVGHAVLKELLDKDISDHSARMGEYLRAQLEDLSKTYVISNIRGLGLLIAFDVGMDKANRISDSCFEEGLLINACKPYSLRLMPPLIVSQDEIDEMLEIVCRYLSKK